MGRAYLLWITTLLLGLLGFRIVESQSTGPPIGGLNASTSISSNGTTLFSSGNVSNPTQTSTGLSPLVALTTSSSGTNLTTSSPLTTTPKATFNSSVSASTNLTCGQNEEVSNCLPCEQSCDSAVRNITTICINDLCFNDGPQFCDCSVAKGFARDFNGKCIPHSQCPIPGCPSGQEWSKGPCDGTCEVPQPNCTLFNCSFPGCACKPGYVRFYGQCIPQAMCPPRREDRCGGCPAGKTCSHHEGYFFHRDRKPQCQWYNPCGFEVEEIDTYGPDK